jgi:PAS domain S-box-containing protein
MNALFEGYPYIQNILKNIEQAVWVIDLRSARVIYVSPAFEAIWGQDCDNLYADPLLLIESTHPEDRVIVMTANLDENRPSMSLSFRILRLDGGLRWVSAHTFLIHEDGAEPSYQVWVVEDITGQNQVDQTLCKALDRSREQFTLSRRMSLARKPEAVLKTLMSASELRSAKRAYVLFFDPPPAGSLQEIEVIASWPFVSGPSASNELPGEAGLFEDLAVLDLFHPFKPVIVTDIPKDQRLTPSVRAVLLKSQIQTLAVFPLVALGNWLGCLLVYFPQETHFEPLELRHIKVLVDQATITLYNLQLLETEAESRHEAERANEIKTRFLAMISHELRTPLTSIKGFTTTLLAEDVTWDAEEQRDFIRTIHQETNRLQELIDHLLDLSRLEAGLLPIVVEPHSLAEIIADGMPQFQVMAQNHVLEIHLPADLPLIRVDARRIVQILVNLVNNAVQYAPGRTEIVIAAVAYGQFLQVSVSDQGPGIPSAERKRVFQAFQRGAREESGTGKGAGLGLAICKGLVEAHGGRIWIKKQSAPGTTISFTVPIVPAQIPVNSPGKA